MHFFTKSKDKNTQNSYFPIILHFAIIYSLGITYFYYTCMVEIPYKDVRQPSLPNSVFRDITLVVYICHGGSIYTKGIRRRYTSGLHVLFC